MKPRRKEKRRIPVLRSGELRADRRHAREALAAVWDEVQPSPSRRFVILLNEKEATHA